MARYPRCPVGRAGGGEAISQVRQRFRHRGRLDRRRRLHQREEGLLGQRLARLQRQRLTDLPQRLGARLEVLSLLERPLRRGLRHLRVLRREVRAELQVSLPAEHRVEPFGELPRRRPRDRVS